MLLKNRQCADAGTENCPCHLAGYGECLVCSRLRGKENCDCNWQGTCIYNEYLQNNRCINGQRNSALYKIEKVTWYEKDLVVMRIAVPRGFAESAALPGSFVFVKVPGVENYFDFPVSVLRADYEGSTIELAVKIAGPKSKAVMEALERNEIAKSQIDDALTRGDAGAVELRGIYRNGLLGAEKLLSAGAMAQGRHPAAGKNERLEPGLNQTAAGQSGRRILCLTKGVGLAPVSNYIRWAAGKDTIDVIADLEKINRRFADDALRDCDVNSVVYDCLPVNLSWVEQEKYDFILIGASDYYQQNIYVPEYKKIVTNNQPMCCGEGVCGACVYMDKNGGIHRMCKCAKML